jgi:NAD(P)H-hydrate epimerase
MTLNPIVTMEIARLPVRADDAHKGQVGRIVVIGGCIGEVTMAGAPALTANAAYRAGAGLVQIITPRGLEQTVIRLAPCATARVLRDDPVYLADAALSFRADVVAIGPGLGESCRPETVFGFLERFTGSVVVDADALNALAALGRTDYPSPGRIVLTPHVGELQRLLGVAGTAGATSAASPVGAPISTPTQRRAAALSLVERTGCTVVLKGHGTVVTNGRRLYVNQTGNSGLASGGTGDVLTGVLAALIGQGMAPLEAAILGVYMHGLAGDFAAEGLGRHCMTALDVVESLPEAFREVAVADTEQE